MRLYFGVFQPSVVSLSQSLMFNFNEVETRMAWIQQMEMLEADAVVDVVVVALTISAI